MENDVLFDIEMAVKLVFDKIGILQEHKQYDNVLGKRWNARFLSVGFNYWNEYPIGLCVIGMEDRFDE